LHPKAFAALEKVAPNLRLFTAAIDERLNDIAYIVPGSRRRRRPAVRAALEALRYADQLVLNRARFGSSRPEVACYRAPNLDIALDF